MSGSIRKRGDTYHVYFRVNGKQHSRVAGPLKRDADALLVKINNEIYSGKYVDIKPMLFSEFAPRWLEQQKPNLKVSSYSKYIVVIKNELVPRFGSLQVSRIDTEMIQGWLTVLSGRGLKPSTVNTYFATMRKLMADAVKWKYVHSNPAAVVDRPKIPKSEIDYLSPEEIGRLLHAAEPKARDHALLMLLATTGVRIGEALALTWDDVDFVKQTINVSKTMHAGVATSPKTAGSRRVVRFPEALKRELMTFQLTSPITKANHVFVSSVGTPLDRDRVRNRILKPALALAGLRSVSVHSLRHSYATMLIHQGENLKFVQSQLGHSSMRVTFDRYGHLLPAAGDEAMRRLDRMVEENFCWQSVGKKEKMRSESHLKLI
ncbi:MAG: site-specific integrase [Actinomycetota bacterium]